MPTLTSTQFLAFCIQYASLTLVYYDYFLTLPREIKFVWRRKFHVMTIVYFLCRYAIISNVVFAIGLYNKFHHMSCDTAYTISACFSVLGRIGILAVLGMRTCAVFANNRAVVGLFSVLGLFVVALAIAHAPRVSCSGAKVVESRIATDLLSVFTVVYEILATAFLGVGCYRNMVHGSLKEQKNGLAFFMLKEGMLYSGFVTLFTTTAMVLNYAAPLGSFFQRLLNALTIPISGIMAARFVLHIRERQARELDLDSGILDSPVMFQMDPQLGKPSSRDSSDADSIETITDDDVSQIYPSRFNNGGFGAGSSSRGQDESSMV